MEISTEQTETERACKGMHSVKRKYYETFVDVVTDTLKQFKKSKSIKEKKEQMRFFESLAESGTKIQQIFNGSIIMVLEFENLSALLCFGALYNSGMFKNMLLHGFITEDFLVSHGLSSVTLTVEVKKEDYQKCLRTMTQGKHCNIYF